MPRTKSSNSAANRIAVYREKSSRKGMTRLEVTVPRHDATLIRKAARTLREGGQQALRLRKRLNETAPAGPSRTTGELLKFFQNSPLAKYDVDLRRDRSPIPDILL